MTEVVYLRRAAWFPLAVPPAVALLTRGSDPARPIEEFVWLTILFGALAYPLFAGLSLRWLRGRSARAYWRFGLAAPILYALFFTVLNGALLELITDQPFGGFEGAAIVAAIGIPVGYGCVIVAAALRFVFVTPTRRPG